MNRALHLGAFVFAGLLYAAPRFVPGLAVFTTYIDLVALGVAGWARKDVAIGKISPEVTTGNSSGS